MQEIFFDINRNFQYGTASNMIAFMGSKSTNNYNEFRQKKKNNYNEFKQKKKRKEKK